MTQQHGKLGLQHRSLEPWMLAPASAQVGKYLQSLKDYPPRQVNMDFNIDEMVHQLNRERTRQQVAATTSAEASTLLVR